MESIKNKNLNEEMSRMKQMMGLKEQSEINEVGAMWLTKIKVNLVKPASDEKKLYITRKMQKEFNGRIAVEFENGEWYDSEGRIEDIDAYEHDVNHNLYGDIGTYKSRMRFRDSFLKDRRNTPDDSPHHYEYDK